MQNTIDNFNIAPSLYDPTILAHPDFLSGFQGGIEAFEAECEDKGRKLTARETCKGLTMDLAPNKQQLLAIAFYTEHFHSPERPLFASGFWAGWIHAHLSTPDAPAVTVRDTQPLGVVVPFRARS